VIDATCLYALIKLCLRSALQGLPMFERGLTVACDGGQHRRPVREEKSIADIEENDTPVRHASILLKTTRIPEDVVSCSSRKRWIRLVTRVRPIRDPDEKKM